jgi:plasmid maintenance system antidote protein VapI
MPTSPKKRRREKEYDATFYNIASSMGLAQSELERLLAGRASVGLAKKLGVIRMDLQRFISGEVSLSMAYALGMPQPQAQALRDHVGREGAVGILIGRVCAATP